MPRESHTNIHVHLYGPSNFVVLKMVCPICGALLPPADDAPIPGLSAAAWPAVASFLFIDDPGLLAVGMASAGTTALLDQIAADHWAIAEEYRARQEE